MLISDSALAIHTFDSNSVMIRLWQYILLIATLSWASKSIIFLLVNQMGVLDCDYREMNQTMQWWKNAVYLIKIVMLADKNSLISDKS